MTSFLRDGQFTSTRLPIGCSCGSAQIPATAPVFLPLHCRQPARRPGWYNGPADAKQSGQNEIAGTHPNPLAPQDIKKYRTFYRPVNKVP
jgi:hypothetical protein